MFELRKTQPRVSRTYPIRALRRMQPARFDGLIAAFVFRPQSGDFLKEERERLVAELKEDRRGYRSRLCTRARGSRNEPQRYGPKKSGCSNNYRFSRVEKERRSLSRRLVSASTKLELLDRRARLWRSLLSPILIFHSLHSHGVQETVFPTPSSRRGPDSSLNDGVTLVVRGRYRSPRGILSEWRDFFVAFIRRGNCYVWGTSSRTCGEYMRVGLGKVHVGARYRWEMMIGL